MSRVGKMPISLPAGVELQTDGQVVKVKGPQGALELTVPEVIRIETAGSEINIRPANDSTHAGAMSGTIRALVANMVEGVSKGFERRLTLVGVGFRAQAQGTNLNLQVGFSHPVVKAMPAGIKVETPTPTEIVIRGADRQVVGQVAADIRIVRPPEPYKGKGIRKQGERVVLKETKKK